MTPERYQQVMELVDEALNRSDPADRAQSLLERSVAVSERTLGAHAPNLANMLLGLAGVHVDRGDLG